MDSSDKKVETLINSAKTITNKILPNIKALVSRKKLTLTIFTKRYKEFNRDLKYFEDEVYRIEEVYKENLKEVTKILKKVEESSNKGKGRNYIKNIFVISKTWM